MSILTNFLGALGTGASSSKIPGLKEVGAGLSQFMSQYEAEQQDKADKEYNAEQAQINRDFQREERLATQEYNSPANQLKLAMEAGINPNAVAASGQNPFVPTQAASGSQASHGGGLASTLLMSDLQAANLMATTRQIQADTRGKEIANSYAPKLNERAIEKAEAEIDKLASDKGFTEEQTRQAKELFPLLKGKNEQELKLLQENINKIIQESRKAVAEADTAEINRDNEKWKKDFREQFGVMPGSGLIDGLIQMIGSGEKGAEIGQVLIDTAFSLCIGALTSIGQNIISLPKRGLKALGDIMHTEGQHPVIVNP